MPRPILFLLDRSGSMETTRDDTIGGFNAFVSDQRALNPDALMTLWQFDHEVLVSYTNKPLSEVPTLTRETFQPRGSTHLLDTIGEAMKSNPLAEPPIVVIFTDGEENGSTKYTRAEKAGDGLMVGDGIRVRFVKSKHSIFQYDMPQPPDGSVGTVKGEFYQFNGTMWAKVQIGDKQWDIRVGDLRVAEPNSSAYMNQAAALATLVHGCGAVGDAAVWLNFVLVVALLYFLAPALLRLVKRSWYCSGRKVMP